MPRLSEIRIPVSEFRNVIILDEFNGEYSLVAGQVNNQNEVLKKGVNNERRITTSIGSGNKLSG